jgi:NMD protein affecting ribosome stability and mRNA decay
MLVREDGDATCYVCGYRSEIGFCQRCDAPHPIDELDEAGGKMYCEFCLEYITADYWHEQRAGK